MENRKQKKSIFIILVVIILITCAVGLTIYLVNKNNSTEYSVQYSSIEEGNYTTYLNLNFETKKEVTLLASDFAVLIDGVPKKADGIITKYFDSTPVIGQSLKVDSNRVVVVSFYHKLSELDKPLTFYYKGSKLELGNKLTFNI